MEQAQQLQRPLVGHLFLLPEAGKAEDAADHAVLHLGIHRHGDVFLYRQVIEQADVLEGTGDTGPVHLSGGHVVGVLPVQKDGAVGRLIHLGQQVEHRGLARAVGADETGDLRPADHEVEIIHGLQAAEGDAQIDAVEDGTLADVTLRDHSAGGDGNQFSEHIRQPPFLPFCQA